MFDYLAKSSKPLVSLIPLTSLVASNETVNIDNIERNLGITANMPAHEKEAPTLEEEILSNPTDIPPYASVPQSALKKSRSLPHITLNPKDASTRQRSISVDNSSLLASNETVSIDNIERNLVTVSKRNTITSPSDKSNVEENKSPDVGAMLSTLEQQIDELSKVLDKVDGKPGESEDTDEEQMEYARDLSYKVTQDSMLMLSKMSGENKKVELTTILSKANVKLLENLKKNIKYNNKISSKTIDGQKNLLGPAIIIDVLNYLGEQCAKDVILQLEEPIKLSNKLRKRADQLKKKMEVIKEHILKPNSQLFLSFSSVPSSGRHPVGSKPQSKHSPKTGSFFSMLFSRETPTVKK